MYPHHIRNKALVLALAMSTAVAVVERPPRITTAQRATIRRMMKERSLDLATVSLMHRQAGISDEWVGRSVDAWLDSLTIEQASVAIDRMAGRVS